MKRKQRDDNGDNTTASGEDAAVGTTAPNGMSADIVWQTPANPPQKQDYIFHNGRRHVRPYYFEFISHVKNRWAGKTIVDLFADEFKGRPREYYVSAVKCGRIQVDGEFVPVSYVVRSSQKISHFLHRHEPPVMSWDIEVLQKEPDVVTICKPASVPVHPCGQYRKNTVVGILQAEYDLAPLFPVHRLDRLVSGLLILARNAPKADIFRQQIEGGMVKKQYIAKVIGVFPEDEIVVDANINYNAREGRSTAEEANASGDNHVKGKPACTKFTRISTNGTHSLILCEPVTGRTHQIRVHLQYTGHPIANDPLYLFEHGNDRSAKGTNADERVNCNLGERKISLPSDYGHSSEDFSIDPMCTNCPNLVPKGYEEHDEGLWLHCVRYSGPGWTYECPYPDWASL
ncbi:PREDICTED: RNA pseudouridine synthase 7 [Tarenaya hassleriana]|uniref:RNA pseudouridine synthase 7 n=1 Tax=Tarenaya hassleriana TaxID=28532 RepID=UPI00053C863F|nr:PREDICTED: RNA pseudouridine synthase 7 [Tarenaya hassleriana]